MSRGKKKRHPSQQQHRPKTGQWDLLNNTFTALADYAKLPTEVAPILRSQEAMEKVQDKSQLVSRAKLLFTDCSKMTIELLNLQKEHAGKRGEPKNPDDYMKCVDIHTRYVDWAERYEAVVYPTYHAINEQIGQDIGVPVMGQKPTSAIAGPDQKDVSND